MTDQLTIGEKVHYIPFKDCSEDEYENGIVKSHHKDTDKVFVVYHWSDEPQNYQNYTGALTNISQLRKGWV